ncbi:hypothetical protein BS47DRAFT_600729 [Hydnum rufescens UP504]|uniref:Zn(2)-C6 fungal-type domain-containing protein n=1 Tax=Hydnum rufescens UP504 TaxID=1448309 RepID=A0A9P6DHS3_9AGAM|nr:hypothetical protein BS47DRAFT_600729 [Hydnum rufescens UP504]
MSDVPPSEYMPSISDDSDSGPRARNDKAGCWPCRFRKKGCKSGAWGSLGPCQDCHRFNILCCGQGIERPPGQALADQVRGDLKIWIGNRDNRAPSIQPLALSFELRPSSSTTPDSCRDCQDPDCTPVATASPFFTTNETSSSQFQGTNTADHASPYNHATPIYPSETGAGWNDTQYLPEDPLSFPPTAFLPSSDNENVLPWSSGLHNILGNMEGYSFTPEQLTFYHDLDNEMDWVWWLWEIPPA